MICSVPHRQQADAGEGPHAQRLGRLLEGRAFDRRTVRVDQAEMLGAMMPAENGDRGQAPPQSGINDQRPVGPPCGWQG